VRARVCNLVGNLCRYSDYFFEPLRASGVLAEVVSCAGDADPTTRKFACFALGNAAFHSAALYPALAPAIAPLVACLAEALDKTRSNAAGALGNLVRNAPLLAPRLAAAGAVTALVRAADPADGADGSSKVDPCPAKRDMPRPLTPHSAVAGGTACVSTRAASVCGDGRLRLRLITSVHGRRLRSIPSGRSRHTRSARRRAPFPPPAHAISLRCREGRDRTRSTALRRNSVALKRCRARSARRAAPRRAAP
jgi:hypothetical protein